MADLRCAGRSFGLAPAFPSTARSYQALTFYPALTYGLNNDRIDGANFRIIGVGNRGFSGIVYRTKVACGRSKQSRHNAWGGRFGKIADPKFHARKIKQQPPISNGKSSAENFKLSCRRDGLFFQTTAKPPAMSTNGAALLNLFWRLNCRTRAIDHLLDDRNGGFWRWVSGGCGNVLSIGVVVIASTRPPRNRLLGLGQPLPRPVLIRADSEALIKFHSLHFCSPLVA